MARARLKTWREPQPNATTNTSPSPTTPKVEIAGGIDEEQLKRQAQEIESLNSSLQAEGVRLQVLRSIELNLTPSGQGDMDPRSLRDLDVCSAASTLP